LLNINKNTAIAMHAAAKEREWAAGTMAWGASCEQI